MVVVCVCFFVTPFSWANCWENWVKCYNRNLSPFSFSSTASRRKRKRERESNLIKIAFWNIWLQFVYVDKKQRESGIARDKRIQFIQVVLQLLLMNTRETIKKRKESLCGIWFFSFSSSFFGVKLSCHFNETEISIKWIE